MIGRRPAAAGIEVAGALEAVGRAQRSACTRPDGAELWRLPTGAEPIATRLLALAKHGIGGFEDAGVDEDGLWLLRAQGEPTGSHYLAEVGARPWREALAIAVSLARAMEACEEQSLFPGPLHPKGFTVHAQGERAATLRADRLVHSLVGQPPNEATGSGGGISRWVAPAQAKGAPSDNDSNRYVLGLFIYRAIAGEHPFGGKGLRLGLADQEGRGAPPFSEAVASSLPPGLQSYCLRLLEPDANERPRRASAIAQRLGSILGSDDPVVPKPTAKRPSGAGRANTPPFAAPGSSPPQTAIGFSPHATHATHAELPDAPAAPEPSGTLAASHVEVRRTELAPSHSDPVAAVQERRAHARALRDAGKDPLLETTTPPPKARPEAKLRAPSATARRARTWLGLLAPFALGGVVASAIWLGEPEPQAAPSRPTVGESTPLEADATRADDCAACHPAQSAQWHVSVMAHSVRSPLFQSLEMLIEEQVGKEFGCPDGAGILRETDGRTACRDRETGLAVTGSGGELWCVNCHAPGENLKQSLPPWNGIAARSSSRKPLRDLLPDNTMDGISCAFCHQVHGPVRPGNIEAGLYEGNPFWTSTKTGERFSGRPEDRRGEYGVANSGYFLDPFGFLATGAGDGRLVPGGIHRRPSQETKKYLASSQFCGSCHDVRLFGTDAIGVQKGEHFKRLRNAYTEWATWAEDERQRGRDPASCQDCHMSAFPGVCVPDEGGPLDGTFSGSRKTALERACPDGTRFEARGPGSLPTGSIATSSGSTTEITTHYFSGVDVPLAPDYPLELIDDPDLDEAGIPRGAKQRRDLLLGSTFRFEIDEARKVGGRLEIPIEIENVGAGHRVPAGFSQEREIWVHMQVTDDSGRVLYEVGRVDAGDQDLPDKRFIRVNTDDSITDGQGRPIGLFGADIVDGPDAPLWSPDPAFGGTDFRGRGLINFQNGFLRCVKCIGEIDARGQCRPGIGQGRTRTDRFDDGQYDPDTGECISNLVGREKFIETYFPVGALDASRGLLKGPDAIIDTRSAPPSVPIRYVYDLRVGAGGPIKIKARLLFRAFPPFLVRGFIDYERRQAARGRRPSGPLVTREVLDRLEVVELTRVELTVP